MFMGNFMFFNLFIICCSDQYKLMSKIYQHQPLSLTMHSFHGSMANQILKTWLILTIMRRGGEKGTHGLKNFGNPLFL